ncbi:MAG: hypothetical protein AAFQ87_05795, partial [Bacteroidota bacterium]
MLTLLTGVLIWVDEEFNLRSNAMLYLVRDTQLDLLLYAESKDDWESVFSISESDFTQGFDTLYSQDGLLHYQLPVKRASEDWRVSALNSVMNPQLNILEFDPASFRFEAAFYPDFKLSTASEMRKYGEYQFC